MSFLANATNWITKNTKETVKEVTDLFTYNKAAVVAAVLPIANNPLTKTAVTKVATTTASIYSTLFKAAPKTTIAVSAAAIPVSQAVLREPKIISTSAKTVGDVSTTKSNVLVNLAQKDYKTAGTDLLSFAKVHPYATTAAGAVGAFLVAKSVSPIAAYVAGKSLINDVNPQINYVNPKDLMPNDIPKSKQEIIKAVIPTDMTPPKGDLPGKPLSTVPSTPMPISVPVPTEPLISPITAKRGISKTTTKRRSYHKCSCTDSSPTQSCASTDCNSSNILLSKRCQLLKIGHK